MNQNEKLDNLLEKLKEDSIQYKDLQVADDSAEKRRAVRSLMNIRMPRTISNDLLQVQDDFLQEEAQTKGIVTIEEIPTVEKQCEELHTLPKTAYADKISVWQGDITRLQVGAIVNAANSLMLGCFVPCHRCIDNAIHSAAGMELREECNSIMKKRRITFGRQYEEPTGTATLTKGYNLPAEYVIHTVGPIVYGNLTESLCRDLENCYQSVLECCVAHHIRSVAFCCISTGEFHFPNEKAAEIAVQTVQSFLQTHADQFDRIIFNVFKDEDRKIYTTLLG